MLMLLLALVLAIVCFKLGAFTVIVSLVSAVFHLALLGLSMLAACWLYRRYRQRRRP